MSLVWRGFMPAATVLHRYTQKPADEVGHSGCKSADPEHAKSAEQGATAGEHGDHCTNDEKRDAADDRAYKESGIAGRQKIGKDGDRSARGKRDERARCGSPG